MSRRALGCRARNLRSGRVVARQRLPATLRLAGRDVAAVFHACVRVVGARPDVRRDFALAVALCARRLGHGRNVVARRTFRRRPFGSSCRGARPRQRPVRAARRRLRGNEGRGVRGRATARLGRNGRVGTSHARRLLGRAPRELVVHDEAAAGVRWARPAGGLRPICGFRSRVFSSDVRYRIVQGARARDLTDVQWADWAHDGRLLVATREGRLEVRGGRGWRTTEATVADLAHDAPAPVNAPSEARRWC